MERLSTPPSREVRLENGVTHGYLEDLLYQAHTGHTSDLIPIMAKAELAVQCERSKAAQEVAFLIMQELRLSGYLTISSIEDTMRKWHEYEVLGLKQPEPEL